MVKCKELTKNEIITKLEIYIKANQLELVKEFFSNNTMLYLTTKQANFLEIELASLGFIKGIQDQIINYKLDNAYINRYYNCTFGKIIFEFNNF